MKLNEAIQVLQQEQEWYYQTKGKGVMVNNKSLHKAIETILDELGKTMTIKCDNDNSILEQKINELLEDNARNWWNNLTEEKRDDYIYKRHAALKTNRAFTFKDVIQIYKQQLK